MTNITVFQVTSGVEKRSWLMSEHGTDEGCTLPVTLDVTKFSSTAVNAVQTVSLGAPTAGTFTLTYGGQTTSAIAFNAAASAVQTALLALSTVPAASVVVTGAAPTYTVTFVGALGSQPALLLTINGAGLTGGTPLVTNTTTGAFAHYPQNYIISGLVLGKNTSSGLYQPYNPGASDGTQTPVGILFSSLRIWYPDGSLLTTVAGALLVHGYVNSNKMPVALAGGTVDATTKTALPLIYWTAGETV